MHNRYLNEDRVAADPRLGCSTISFRHRSLDEALSVTRDIGFAEIDLGALPGVCDHVPARLDDVAIASLAQRIRSSGLIVRSINADIGDLNRAVDAAEQRERDRHVAALIKLAREIGSRAIVLPCGRLNHGPIASEHSDLDLIASQLHRAAQAVRSAGVELWVEALHSLRFCHDVKRAIALVSRLDCELVGVVFDVSHVVAAGDEPEDYLKALEQPPVHVHLRDAIRGDIHRSIGAGNVDFGGLTRALAEKRYAGHYTLELETNDVAENERAAETARAAAYFTKLLSAAAL